MSELRMSPKAIERVDSLQTERLKRRYKLAEKRAADLKLQEAYAEKNCVQRWDMPLAEMRRVLATAPEARGRYTSQRSRAWSRGIEWQLTFAEWWRIWHESGKWDQRGKGIADFCMGRFGDVGPYAMGNVYICTNRENLNDLQDNKRRSRLSFFTHCVAESPQTASEEIAAAGNPLPTVAISAGFTPPDLHNVMVDLCRRCGRLTRAPNQGSLFA